MANRTNPDRGQLDPDRDTDHTGPVSVIRYDTAPEQPWRNGRGVTRELHTGPGWRLSIATLDRAGPFSTFPGLDRVFIVAGGQVELDVEGTTRSLTLGDQQRFPGEATIHVDPGTGPAFAVNVMSTRTSHIAEVRVTRIDGPAPEASALVVLQGRVDVDGTPLTPFDAAMPARAARGFDALVVLITVRPSGTEPPVSDSR